MNDMLIQLKGSVLQGCQNGDCEKSDGDMRELSAGEMEAITGAIGKVGHAVAQQ